MLSIQSIPLKHQSHPTNKKITFGMNFKPYDKGEMAAQDMHTLVSVLRDEDTFEQFEDALLAGKKAPETDEFSSKEVAGIIKKITKDPNGYGKNLLNACISEIDETTNNSSLKTAARVIKEEISHPYFKVALNGQNKINEHDKNIKKGLLKSTFNKILGFITATATVLVSNI